MQTSPTSHEDIQCIDFNHVFSSGAASDIAAATKLLRKIHAGIYCDTFPIPNEQEAVDDWVERLEKGKKHEPRQFFTAYGKHLDDPEKAEIVGFIVSEYYNGTQTGLFNYVLREKTYTEKFPAKQMCDHHLKLMKDAAEEIDHKPLKAALWEANDPNHPDFAGENWRKNDCMDPAKRVAVIERQYGAKKLGFNYAQAPLEPLDDKKDREDATCDALLLYQYAADQFPDFKPQDLQNFLTKFRQSFSGASGQADDLGVASLAKMDKQLSRMVNHNIPLREDQQADLQKRMVASAKAPLAGAIESWVRRQEEVLPSDIYR